MRTSVSSARSRRLLLSLACCGCAESSRPAFVPSVPIEPAPEVAIEPTPELLPPSGAPESFSEFARRFAEEFSSKAPTLDRFVHPDWGLFVLYNAGVAPTPYHFRSFAEVLDDEEGFAYLKRETLDCELQEVDVVPRPLGNWPWECEAEIPPGCFVGSAGRTPIDRLAVDHFGSADESDAELGALRKLLEVQLEEATFAISSTESFGAGYLFRKEGTSFYLAIIDRVDVCSA